MFNRQHFAPTVRDPSSMIKLVWFRKGVNDAIARFRIRAFQQFVHHDAQHATANGQRVFAVLSGVCFVRVQRFCARFQQLIILQSGLEYAKARATMSLQQQDT